MPWEDRRLFFDRQSPVDPLRSRSAAPAVNISFIMHGTTTIDTKNGAADAVAEMIEVQAIR
jgi:hypothetical protein